MALQESKKATLADWEALGEDFRAELIDGEIYYMAPPSRKHQETLMFLSRKIGNYLEGKPCKVYPAPFGVYLHNEDGTTDAVEPDISVICDKDKLSTRGCEGAPTWIIEIVSPGNMAHDYVTKLSLYMRHGVKEYWIVNPDRETITVYHLTDQDISPSVYTFRDTVQVQTLTNLNIDFTQLDLE